MTRLQRIAGLPVSESKLKLLEAIRANDNLTVEELLQLLQYRTNAKKIGGSSVHQSPSSAVAYAEKRGSNNKKDLSRRQKPQQCGRCGQKQFQLLYECPATDEKCHNCSKQRHYPRMCKAKRQEASLTEVNPIENETPQCNIYLKNKKTMFYAEQIAPVEEIHHIGSKTDFHSIKLNGHDIQ